MPKRIFTTMVADLFHFGHVNFLRSARELGEHLTVGLVTDQRAASYKRRPILSYHEREQVLMSCRYVDAVVPVNQDVTAEFMSAGEYDLRVYAVSTEAEEVRMFATLWSEMDKSKMMRLDYTPEISTTEIISRVVQHSRER